MPSISGRLFSSPINASATSFELLYIASRFVLNIEVKAVAHAVSGNHWRCGGEYLRIGNIRGGIVNLVDRFPRWISRVLPQSLREIINIPYEGPEPVKENPGMAAQYSISGICLKFFLPVGP